MKKLLLLLTFGLGLWTWDGSAATYYVTTSANGGSDSHGCSTTDSAGTNKATILGGYGCLSNGDTLLVHAGTYVPFTLSSGGISGSPKTIKAAPGETVIVRDGSTQNVPITGNGINTVFLYVGANWVVIDGLTVKRGENAILVYGNNNIIRNCIATEAFEAGILVYATGAQNNLVENCIIYNNNQVNWPRGNATAQGVPWGSALNAAEGAGNNIFQDNYVYWNHGEGLNIWTTTGAVGSGNIVRRNVVADNWAVNLYVSGPTNTTVDSNIVYETNAAKNWSVGGFDNNPEGIGISIEGNGTLVGTKITNNIVINCRDGLNAFSQSNGHAYTGWIVENNTFVRNDNGFQIHNNISETNMTISNNIVLQGSGGLIMSILNNPSANTFRNNLYFGSAGNAFQYGATTTNYAGWVTATGETGSVNSNPTLVSGTNIPPQLWTDPSTDPVLPLTTRIALSADYAPQTTSPAKNAGLTTSNVTLDFAGYARPQGSAYDIGALEFITAVPPPTSTISMSYPNGGENFLVGAAINIMWASNDTHTVKLEISRDGGSTYPELIATGLAQTADSNNSYAWTPTAPQSYTAKIRVTNLFDSVADESNAVCKIRGNYIK